MKHYCRKELHNSSAQTEIPPARVPVENFTDWHKVLMEDDPPGSKFSNEEWESFSKVHMDLALKDAINRGLTFEDFFKELLGKLKEVGLSDMTEAEIVWVRKTLEVKYNYLLSNSKKF
jgi:hypothetical protein